MIEMTPLETLALARLNEESEANGHDFGVMELVDWKNRNQLGGVVTSLLKKGILESVDEVQYIDGEAVTQYYIAAAHKDWYK